MAYSYDRTAGVVIPFQTKEQAEEQAYDRLHSQLQPAREAAKELSSIMANVAKQCGTAYSTMQRLNGNLALLRHKAEKAGLDADVKILERLKEEIRRVDSPTIERFDAAKAREAAALFNGLVTEMSYK